MPSRDRILPRNFGFVNWGLAKLAIFFIVAEAQDPETIILFAQEKNRLQQRRQLIIFSALLLGGFLMAIYLLPRKDSATPTPTNNAEVLQLPERQRGTSEVCRFWRPWEDALAPLTPSEVMTTIAKRARTRASRTKEFAAWAEANHRSKEHICAVGTTINGEFTFDLVKDLPTNFSKDDDSCRTGPAALDYAMAMHVDKGPIANLNAFTLQLSTGPLSAKRLRKFISDQTQLVYAGYQGWEIAYPDFSKEKTSGIGIKHTKKPLGTDVAEVSMHIGWNPQRFWTQVPTLATWLLNLGGLVTLDTKVTDGSGQLLAELVTSTKSLGTQVRLPLTEKGIIPGGNTATPTLTPDSDFDLNVMHKVTIGFKGLNIVVNNLAFHGTVTQSDDRLWYDGKFVGIGVVEVTGEYKGLGALGLNDAIRTMIVEAIEKEVANIEKGNNGQGWLVHASLGPSADSSFNIFQLSMELEAPIHITELMRYESEGGNDVMPDKTTSFEFKNYADSIFASLVKDSHRFDCSQLKRRP